MTALSTIGRARSGVVGFARRRPRLAALAVVLATAAGMFAFWQRFGLTLAGLPDVGDPFDVAAFKATVVLPERNAFAFYQPAADGFVAPDHKAMQLQRSLFDGWEGTDAGTRAWLERNRPALELWRSGTERPEARLGDPWAAGRPPAVELLGGFDALARLEASRLVAAGDLAGAWGWYRAALRSSRHAGQAGDCHRGQVLRQRVGEAIARWAADPRVDADLLRRAIDDARDADALTVSPSIILKRMYLEVLAELESPTWLPQLATDGGRSMVWYRQLPGYATAAIVAGNEPERGRRVARLIFANWLASAARPPEDRPATIEPTFVLSDAERFQGWGNPTLPLTLYDAPAPDGRAIAPERLASWYGSSLIRKVAPDLRVFHRLEATDRGTHAAIVAILARQLYRREHAGAEAPSLDALGAIPQGYDAKIEERLLQPPKPR